MRNLFLLFITFNLISISTPLLGQKGKPQKESQEDLSTYFIKLKPNTDQTKTDRLLEELNSEEVWKHEESNLRIWSVKSFPFSDSDGTVVANIDEFLVRSKKKTEIDDSNKDLANVFFSSQPGREDNYFAGLDLSAPQGSNPIKISIIDSGISDLTDNDHPDYNFGVGSVSGYDYVNKDNDPDDENGHGSHLAGLIHHIVNQETSVSNISLDIRKAIDKDGIGKLTDIVMAIIEAVDAGADILNMSYSYNGFSGFDPVKEALDYALSKGVLVVTSAGNNGDNIDDELSLLDIFPALFDLDNIISVASVNNKDRLSSFSNYGAISVDVAVLGEKIPGPDLSTGLTYNSGTSYSSAMVTAMAAILGTRQNEFDHNQIKCALIYTSKFKSALFGKVRSSGVIDFQAAVDGLSSNCNLNWAGKYTEQAPVLANGALTVYPNPFRGTINASIDLLSDEPVSIAVYDELGRRLLFKSLDLQQGANRVEITESNSWIPGTYFMRITSSNETISRKLMKR